MGREYVQGARSTLPEASELTANEARRAPTFANPRPLALAPVAGGTTKEARWPFRIATVLLIVIAALATWARVELILSKGTYPLHRDELHITKHAFKILTTGDLNPHFFRYGSLPIYLTTASMGVAAKVARIRGHMESLDEVTSVGYPYYSHPEISLAPRFLFALISVVGLLAIGLLGYRTYKHPALLVLAPLALVTSDLYLRSSWAYVNVDVLATVLCFAALAHLVTNLDSHAWFDRAFVPALFLGAVTATKYNSGVLGVPFVIAILLGPKPLRVKQLAWLFVLSLAGYTLFAPYSFLDWTRFTSDIRYEIHHYRTGHPGHDGEPGLAQFAHYFGVMLEDYGPYLTSLGALGLVYGIIRQPRSTALVLSFPLAMLLHMATNRVNFPRTVLPVFALHAMFIGLGVVALLHAARRAGTWIQTMTARQARDAAAMTARAPMLMQGAVVALLLAALGPSKVISGVVAAHTASVDSRSGLTTWLLNHAPRGCLLLIPSQVPFDPRPLAGHCDVRELDLEDSAIDSMLEAEMRAVTGRAILVAFPRWGFDEERPGDADRAETWSRLLDRFGEPQELLKLGRDHVLVNSRSPLMGNPQLNLYRVTGWK